VTGLAAARRARPGSGSERRSTASKGHLPMLSG
jgi:hypothetical protein